ncbi:MAG TPA: ATP-binding protein [Aggregatilineales bacterium]|nr:ATP-binding protein [Aggregatilineales bacterium]
MLAQSFTSNSLQDFITYFNRFNLRHVRLAYGLAVLITGVVGLVAFVVLVLAAVGEVNTAEAIHLNTEQRMHMQRATLLMSVLSTSEQNGSQDSLRTELGERLRLIEEDHAAFVQSQPSNALPDEVVSIYFGPANRLDDLLAQFMDLAQPMVNGSVDSDNRDEIYQSILTISPLLREAYNQVIRVYDGIHLEQATSLRTFAFLFIVLLLIVLVLEVLFIFHPMELRLRQQHEALTTEIERRKQTELALRRSEESYRLLAQNLPDMAVLMFDHDLRYTLAEGPALADIGYSREGIEGKTLEESVLATGYQMLEPYYRGTLQDQSATLEHQTLGRDYFTQFVPVYDEQQRSTGGMVISQDITVRKQAQEAVRVSQLEQARLRTSLEKEQELSELKSRMMLRIAHEFRTPLTIILSSLETLERYADRLTPEQRATKRQTMNQQIQKLTRMLDDIGLAVRGDFAAIVSIRSTIDLNDLLKAVIVTVEAELGQHNRFALSVPTGIQVTGDAVSLKRAFHEILSNAVRFSKQETSIQVRAELEDSTVKVEITDQGIGIPQDEQARIMTPFFRGSNINERGGLGLGLTLAHDVVKAHQGTLNVSSQERIGTTVTVSLPS